VRGNVRPRHLCQCHHQPLGDRAAATDAYRQAAGGAASRDCRRFDATRCQSPSPPVAAAIVAFRALPLDRIVQRLSMFRNLERLRRLM